MTVVYRYRAFGESLDSDQPLPGLPPRAGNGKGLAGLRITCGGSHPPEIGGFKPVIEWPAADGRPYCRLSRRNDRFWFEFPGHAGFMLDTAGAIQCVPEPGCADRLWQHFLLNQAVPRLLGHMGRLVLHAGAVVLADGRAVLLCGPSGRGKSTLAAAFLAQGDVLLADDCVLLQRDEDHYRVFVGMPALRLKEGDIERQFGSDGRFAPVDAYSGKRQAIVDEEHPVSQIQGVPLGAVFLLDPPADDIVTQRMSGMDALAALKGFVYTLDHREERGAIQAFRQVGAVLDEGIPAFRLAYPWHFDRLPDVLRAIRGAAGAGCGTRRNAGAVTA